MRVHTSGSDVLFNGSEGHFVLFASPLIRLSVQRVWLPPSFWILLALTVVVHQWPVEGGMHAGCQGTGMLDLP
jgi:hypothetical protein